MLKTCVILLSLACPVLAAPASQRVPPSAAPDSNVKIQTATRVYDVHELVRDVPDYPLDESIIPTLPGGNAGSLAGRSPAVPVRPTLESLSKLIMSTVDSESWKDNGGAVGSISSLPGRLVITQSEQTQTKVQQLLSQLQADALQTVRVEATWLLLTADEMQTLRDRSPQAAGSAIVRIDDKAMKGIKAYCQGQTLGFDGQTVHIYSGTERSYVSDLTPVVGAGAVGYSPTMAKLHSGVALQVTPQLATLKKSVVLDLENIVSEASGLGSEDALNSAIATTQPVEGQGQLKAIDRPAVLAQQFRTTVQIPLGVNVLVGGMTFGSGTDATSTRQLYLIVNTTASE